MAADLGEVDEFVGIFVEVEEHPGLTFEHGVFPAVAGDDPAPRAINTELEGGGADDLEVGGIGIGRRGFAGEALGGVVGAGKPIGHVEAAEPERGGGEIDVVEDVVAAAGF